MHCMKIKMIDYRLFIFFYLCICRCDVENCNEEFKDYLQFKSHQREHIAKSRILECPDPDCTQTFQKWSELASHKKSHRKVVGK